MPLFILVTTYFEIVWYHKEEGALDFIQMFYSLFSILQYLDDGNNGLSGCRYSDHRGYLLINILTYILFYNVLCYKSKLHLVCLCSIKVDRGYSVHLHKLPMLIAAKCMLKHPMCNIHRVPLLFSANVI